jgi:hypothetical protein
MAAKPNARSFPIREQIVEDHHLTMWIREEGRGFVIALVGPCLEFGNREFAFDTEGDCYGAGSSVASCPRPSWLCEVT